MTDERIISWIFLAIANGSQVEPINHEGICEVADGINHAVPTQQEIRLATTWLLSHNYIIKKRKKYQLTPEGNQKLELASSESNTTMGVWNNLEQEITKQKT